MIDVTIANGSKSFYGNPVLKDIELTINNTDRIAVIGENGSGKSTLLSILSGDEELSMGTISKRKGLKAAFLKQHINLSDLNIKAIDYLKQEYHEIFRLEAKLREYESVMATGEYDDGLFTKYGSVQERFEKLGGYEYESVIYKVAKQFSYDIEKLENNISTMSFGEMKILEFIRLLLKEPEMLLLDEPTNHLDYEKVEVLSSYLKEFNGSIIYISHDRYFIDNISKDIFHLENAEITEYHGNYSFFIAQYKLLHEQLSLEYKQQQLEIKRIKEQIQRYKTWGVKNEKFLTMAKRLQKKLDELPVLSKPQEAKAHEFEKDVVLKKFAIQYNNYCLKLEDKSIVNNLTFDVLRGDVLQISGSNGTGKTTFLKDIYNKSKMESDNIRFYINTKVMYLPQEIVYENENQTVLEYCLNNIEENSSKARSLLAKYNFKADMVNHKLSTLSGGQKVRLELVKLFTLDCNLLLLDEPTNHIDILTKEALENFILSFGGTVIFISHDRYFINKVKNKELKLGSE